MTIFKKTAAVLALALAGVLGLALPAQASTVNGCEDGWVCVYSSGNGLGGRYGFHVQNLYAGYCWAYPFSGQGGWPNGAVANQISSIILNRAGVTGTGHYVTFHDDSYCGNTYKGSFDVPVGNSLQIFSELSFNSPEPWVNWDNSINSVSFS